MPIPLFGDIGDAGSEWAGVFRQPTMDTNPDSMGHSFSSAATVSTGFGPGDYSGGYTGEGDRVYWGPYDDVSSTSSHQSNMGPSDFVPDFGPGYAVTHTSSTGDTILLPPSQTTSVVAPPSSTGDTVLGPAESAVVQPASTIGATDVTEVMSRGPIGPSGVHKFGGVPGVLPDDASGTQITSGTNVREGLTETDISLSEQPMSIPASEATGTTTNTQVTTDVIAGSGGKGLPGSVELQPLGPDVGVDSSVYDGDSYHGTYTEPVLDASGNPVVQNRAAWSGQDAPGEEVEGLGGDLPGGSSEVQYGTQSDIEQKMSVGPEEPSTTFGDTGPALPGDAQVQSSLGDSLETVSFLDSEAHPEVGGYVGDNPYIPELDAPAITPYETPVGGNPQNLEMGILNRNGNPMLLNDVPESSVMSWDMINMSDVPAANLPVLSEMMSDGSNLSLSSAGVGTNLTGFLRNRAVDLIGGQLLFPIFNWLDDTTGDPWTSRVIQGTLATMGLVIGGDPFGVIAAPICWGIQEFMKQRQRLKTNNDPESERGRKFGYVREGDKWYPAIQTLKERDEGWIGSNKTQVTFQYGNEIKWRKGKLGEWIPYFEEGTYGMKEFHTWDSETDDAKNEAGVDYQRRADPLRDFYYLSEEETLDYLHGVMGGDSVSSDRDHEYTPEEQAAIEAARQESFSSFGSNVHDDESWGDYWEANGKDDKEREGYGNRAGYVDQLQDVHAVVPVQRERVPEDQRLRDG